MAQRFVILRHSVNGGEHFDLMLEVPGEEKLRSWRLAQWPIAPGQSCNAEKTPPHRPDYLHYEGELSGGRGTVARVLAGTWRQENDTLVFSDGTRLALGSGRARRV